MQEILYDTASLEVRGWCADENQFGNFKPKEGQAIVIFPTTPFFMSDWYKVDLANQTIVGNPLYDPRPLDQIRAEELLQSSAAVITQPEQWELFRIFGRRLGYRF